MITNVTAEMDHYQMDVVGSDRPRRFSDPHSGRVNVSMVFPLAISGVVQEAMHLGEAAGLRLIADAIEGERPRHVGHPDEVEEDASGVPLADVIRDLWRRAGMDASDLDLTGVNDMIDGYVVPNYANCMPCPDPVPPPTTRRKVTGKRSLDLD